jgi:hypothetical protein
MEDHHHDIHSHAVANCHHKQAQCTKTHTEEKVVRASEDIDDLSYRQVSYAANNIA